MFDSFKKLFRKDMVAGLATSIPETFHATANPSWAARHDAPPTLTFSPQVLAPTTSLTGVESSPQVVALPVKTILASLPNSLTSVVQSQGNGFVSLPARRILQELPKGSVKLPFGEIRQAAPAGTFFDNARFDQMLIELPLNEILPRLHPSLLSRRPNQKQIFISPEVTNVFGPRGEGISICAPPEKAAASAPVIGGIMDAPILAPIAAPIMARPVGIPFVPPTPPPRVLPAEAQPVENADRLEIPMRILFEKWPQTIRRQIAESNLTQATICFPADKIEPALKTGKIIFTWRQICEWIQPRVENISAADDLSLELPLEIVAPLFFAKRRPAKTQKKISMGEIPDLFTSRRTEPSVLPKPAAHSPVLQAEKSAAVTAAPLPHKSESATPVLHLEPIVMPPKIKPFVMPADAEPVPASSEIKPAVPPVTKQNSLGEIFGQPTKQDWSPAEIVKNLAAMPGLDGAFIAMQDGLLVAAELPGNFKAETVAAFLPQIFGRMNQYAKELKLGALSSLGFETENVSWQIVKTGAVYLVALGHPGRDLPKEKLNAIATAISKQIQ